MDGRDEGQPPLDEEAEETPQGSGKLPVLSEDEAGRDIDVPAGELGQEELQHAGQEHYQVEGDMPREPRKLNLIVSKLSFQCICTNYLALGKLIDNIESIGFCLTWPLALPLQ